MCNTELYTREELASSMLFENKKDLLFALFNSDEKISIEMALEKIKIYEMREI